MNQNYEKHLLQKCMVAVAFAIIKSKPLGRSLEEYVNDVKNKLEYREDLSEDVSISESDFGNCDNEINDVNNLDIETEAILPENNISDKDFLTLDSNFNTQANSRHINESFGPVEGINRIQIENMSILVDVNTIKENHHQELVRTTSIKEVLDIFKDIDKINDNKIFISTSTSKAHAQSTQESNSQTSLTKASTADNDNTFCSFGDKATNSIDTQNTELYTVHGYTDNYTHISQSQDIDIVVPKKLIQNRYSNINVGDKKKIEKFEHVSNVRNGDNVFNNINNITRTEDTFYKSYNNDGECNTTISRLDTLRTNEVVDSKTKKIKLSKSSVSKSSDEYGFLCIDNNEINNTSLFNEIEINSNISLNGNKPKERPLENRHKLQNVNNDSTFSSTSFLNDLEINSNSHLRPSPKERPLESQHKLQNVNNQLTFSSTSLLNDLEINSNSLLSSNKPKERPLENQNKFQNVKNKLTFSNTSLLNELELNSNSLVGCSQPRERIPEYQNRIQYVEFDIAAVNIENNFNLSDNQFTFASTDPEIQHKTDLLKDSTGKDKAKGNDNNAKSDGAANNCKCRQLSSGYETQCPSRNLVLDSPNEIGQRSDAEDPEEIVTFKILEELSRVKNYLNRQDRFSDSGRSSQGSQLSGAKINESGYCLLNYLVEYPLIERSLDIVEEVSRILGELVDRLHDYENYPQFVDKILEKTQELVNDIYEEDRTEDLFKKEDQINRLLHLNRSINVTKFTIEKMLPILQEVHLRLQRKDFLELELVKTENLCYILHTLEVLLKRYNATASSQASTQPSQQSQEDEKSLKRSTITEIWRKRWNLSRSDVSEGSFKKKCVLTQISEVLNKMIVEGMEGYSLISFQALQCFNLLQS
ncbi:metacaspase-2-like [Aricia agestis]|uniref:metacaspase-2-like n=1 Tax=Aricia agestis TaxID=91739 RepID=UPI001C204A9C|nr:metacaspase-2-like [Aricia agestis]